MLPNTVIEQSVKRPNNSLRNWSVDSFCKPFGLVVVVVLVAMAVALPFGGVAGGIAGGAVEDRAPNGERTAS